ncbi:MAG: ATP phosphoribosyltransferase [Planctomycetota bacterium]
MSSPLPDNVLRLGLPSGSMQSSTFELFNKAGYHISARDRSVFPGINDEQIKCILFRAQEMSRYVVDDIVDCGLTGYDWIVENGNADDVEEICELTYSRASSRPAKWVLCVPDESPIKKPEDLAGKLIATELVNTTKRYFEQKNIPVRVEFSWGTTEIKARIVDGIVDLTETGGSLRANNLRILDTLLESTIRFVASRKALGVPWKREKIENIAMLLEGAIRARSKSGLKLNCTADNKDKILGYLPALKSPTINETVDGGFAIEIIIDENLERDLIPRLKRDGATEIFSYPLNKIIP